jgi:hypothetical protein
MITSSSVFHFVAVHSSVLMKKREYYLLYKDVELKYIPTKDRGETDNLIIKGAGLDKVFTPPAFEGV